MLEKIKLHVDKSQLFKTVEDTVSNLSHIKLTFCIFILIVFQHIKLGRDGLFKSKFGNLRFSILERVWFVGCKLLQKFLTLFNLFRHQVSSRHRKSYFLFVNKTFPNLDLLLFQDAIMVEQSEILDIENLCHLDPLGPFVHNSEQQISLIVWSHHKFEVLSRHLLQLFVARKN